MRRQRPGRPRRRSRNPAKPQIMSRNGRGIFLLSFALGLAGYVGADTVCEVEKTPAGVSSALWSEFIPEEPEWIPAVAASHDALASAICAAQGSDYDPAETGSTDSCTDQQRPPSPTLITLTSDISLGSSRLPKVWGKVKIQGGCGGVGGSCTIHAESQDCSACPTIWDSSDDSLYLFEFCSACGSTQTPEFRFDNTPLTLSRAANLWLKDLELVGGFSESSGGLLSMDKGSNLVWTDPNLQGDITFVEATDVTFRKGYSALQGGAAFVEQGGLMVLRSCQFFKNFAGQDRRDPYTSSAHDVSVANYGRLIVEDPFPSEPEIRFSSLSDVDRRLGECLLVHYNESMMSSPPPPPDESPSESSSTKEEPSGIPCVDCDSGEEEGLTTGTRVIIIVVGCVGGSALIICLVCTACCLTATDEEKTLKPTQRISRRVTRAVSTLQTGLVRVTTLRPRYVAEGDQVVTFWQRQQDSEEATRRAERRAERAEQRLRDHGIFGSAVGGFASAGASLYASMKRSVSRAFSTRRGVSRMSQEADGFASAYASKATTMAQPGMDETLPNQTAITTSVADPVGRQKSPGFSRAPLA